ncbi:unnamed protein product [Closterium sp. NIES-54]
MVDDSARARLDYLWAAAVADNGWAFHTSKSPAVQNFVDAAVAFGKQYTLPSPFRVSGVLLQKLVAHTEDLVRPLKESWNTSGCTISVDGWTCMKSRGLVCVIAHNDTAPVIVKTVDSKTAKKMGEYLAGLVRHSIADVGDKKVVQLVMDNASNNRRAAKILRDGFPAIFFNNCAAHVLDLMLHDIGNIRAVKRVLNQVHRVVMIVKGSVSAVSLFHELFSTLSLVRPDATRLGTQVIMLTRFLEVKRALKEIVISEEREAVAVARSDEGRAVCLLLLDEVFWDCVTVVLRLMTPVYEVLRVVDIRALVMGQIYGLMPDATVKTNDAAEAAVPRGGEERFRGKAGGGSGDPGPWGGCRSPHADVDAVDAVSPGKGADRPATSSEVERYWSAIARVQRWDCNCLTARRMMDVTKVVFARRAREAFDRKSRGREKLYADLANGTLKQGSTIEPSAAAEEEEVEDEEEGEGTEQLCTIDWDLFRNIGKRKKGEEEEASNSSGGEEEEVPTKARNGQDPWDISDGASGEEEEEADDDEEEDEEEEEEEEEEVEEEEEKEEEDE